MSSISVTCPHCNIKMSVPGKFAGATTKCPACGNALVIPSGNGAAPQKGSNEEHSAWYKQMTGEDDGGAKSALDQLHRDTKVDVSEVVTRWDEDTYDDSEGDDSMSVSSSRRAPASGKSSGKGMGSRRPSPQGRPRPERRDARTLRMEEVHPQAKGLPIGLFIGGFIVVVGVGLGLFFLMKGGDAPQPVPSDNAIAQLTPGDGTAPTPANASTAGGNAVASAEPAPTPEPTKEETPEEKAKKNLIYGKDALERYQFDKAAEYLEKYLEFNPKDEEVWNLLIKSYEEARQAEKLIAALDKAISALGDKPELILKKAEALEGLEKWADTIEAYDKYLTVCSEDQKATTLEMLVDFAMALGASSSSKVYLDKSWEYLQKFKKYTDADTYNDYKESLRLSYEEAGLAAPF